MPRRGRTHGDGGRHHDILIVEGQGSLLHPGSTATLPLMRGHAQRDDPVPSRAGMTRLDTAGDIPVPPLREVIALNEAVAGAAGALTPGRVVGIALNTRDLDERRHGTRNRPDRVRDRPAGGRPVRFEAGPLAAAVLAARG